MKDIEMTSSTATSPHDTAEIQVGEATQRLAPYDQFSFLPRRPMVDDETSELTLPVVDFTGPSQPRPPSPLPPPPAPKPSAGDFTAPTHPRPPSLPPKPHLDMAAAQPLFPLERVLDPSEIVFDLAAGAAAAPEYVGRHRRPVPSVWSRLGAWLTGLVKR